MRDSPGELAESFHFLTLAQLFLRSLQVGDVARLEQQIEDRPILAPHRLHRDVEISGLNPFALELDLGGEDLAFGRGRDPLFHRPGMLRVGAHGRRVPDLVADRLGRVGMAPALAAVVDREHGAVGLQQHHHLERRLEHRPELRLRRGQLHGALLDQPPKLELGLLGERDVGRRPDEAGMLAVGPEAG